MARSTALATKGLAVSMILGFGLVLSACGGSSNTVEKGDPATGSSEKGDSATGSSEKGDSGEVQGKILESGFGQDGQYVYPVTLVKNTSYHRLPRRSGQDQRRGLHVPRSGATQRRDHGRQRRDGERHPRLVQGVCRRSCVLTALRG